MLTQWLTKLEPIHVAGTDEELEAVYRFRYTIYHEEYGRQLGNVDVERRWVSDPEDVASYTTILYAGSVDDMTGTVRLRHWKPGEIPEYDMREMSMDMIPDLGERYTAEIGRFMIRKSLRGRLLLASFARAAYDLLCGEQQTELSFCYCAPGLVHYYRKLGARPFGGRLVHTPDGMMVPLVSVVSDYDYFKRNGSPLAPLVKRHFGRGKRDPIPLAPYQHLFESDQGALEVDAEKIWGELQDAVGVEADFAPIFQSLPEPIVRQLTDKGFIIHIDEGALVTRKDHAEEEMYLILDGEFEVRDGEKRLAVMGKGELFGELAFFIPSHRRTASVKATTEGRVLAVRARTLRKLIESDPSTAAELLLRIGRVMAERLAAMTAQCRPDQPESEIL